MRKFIIGVVLITLLAPVSGALATPIFTVQEGSPVFVDIPLGATLDFSYMFEVLNPVPQGSPWTVMPLQLWVDAIPFVGQVAHNSTTGWLEASLVVPGAYIGTTQPVRFSVNEFGQDTYTTVYVDLGGEVVPEPATMILFVMGGIATAVSRKRFLKKQ